MLPDPEKKGVRNSNLSFVRKRMFWAGAFMLFFYISVEYSVVGWLVTYFQDIGLLGQDSSQMMSTLFWVMMFSGRMLGAVISGRVSRMKLLLLDSIGCIRAIERGSGSTGHILDVVDVLHGYVADGTRSGCLAVDVAIGVVHDIEQRRARIEVVDTHTVYIDDGSAVGECR